MLLPHTGCVKLSIVIIVVVELSCAHAKSLEQTPGLAYRSGHQRCRRAEITKVLRVARLVLRRSSASVCFRRSQH